MSCLNLSRIRLLNSLGCPSRVLLLETTIASYMEERKSARLGLEPLADLLGHTGDPESKRKFARRLLDDSRAWQKQANVQTYTCQRGKRNVRVVTEFSASRVNDAALRIAQQVALDKSRIPTLAKIDKLVESAVHDFLKLPLVVVSKPQPKPKTQSPQLTEAEAENSGEKFVRLAEPFTSRGLRVGPADAARKRWLIWNPIQCATRNPSVLYTWGGRMADAGVGVLTGAKLPDGRYVAVIDKDRHETFSDGFKTFAYCQEEFSETPETFTVITGGNGEQEYFSTAKPVRSSVGLLGPGLDVRGLGGLAIGAGIHSSRKPYQILRDLPIAELPAEWEDALAAKPDQKRELTAVGERHNHLRSVAFAMANQAHREAEILNTLRQRLAFNCESGGRLITDDELQQLAASAVVKVSKADRMLDLIVA